MSSRYTTQPGVCLYTIVTLYDSKGPPSLLLEFPRGTSESCLHPHSPEILSYHHISLNTQRPSLRATAVMCGLWRVCITFSPTEGKRFTRCYSDNTGQLRNVYLKCVGMGARNAHGGNFGRKPERKGNLGEPISGQDANKEM